MQHINIVILQINIGQKNVGPLNIQPGDLKTRLSTGSSCQIEIHFSI